MRWRNQILALLCLAIFLALGVLYFREWVVQKPFGIVLLIGEGLTPERIAATRVFAGGATSRLTIETLPATALLSNYSQDFAVPDEAAAATTLATGLKVNNRSLATNAKGKPLQTLIDLAREKGRAIGLVTNTRLTDPTVAAFYGHGQSVPQQLALQLIEARKIDVALGGGRGDFLPEAKGGDRTDGRDLLFEARRNGYQIVRTKGELENIPSWRRPKLLGLFSPGDLAFANAVTSGSDQPALTDLTRRAIQLLQWNRTGYLLIVDAGLMRVAARENKGERTLGETLELDRAVGTAQSYSGSKSMILVSGNVGVGGLTLSGFPFRRDSGVALLGLNSSGEPALTWATGPNGLKTPAAAGGETSSPSISGTPTNSTVPVSQEPAAFFAPAARNTLADVLAAGTGPGTENLRGFGDNSMIFQIIQSQL